jgi:hypothetical protein
MTFLDGLTLLFIALKLTNVIEWSWLLVLAPIIIPWALAALFILAGKIVGAFTGKSLQRK